MGYSGLPLSSHAPRQAGVSQSKTTLLGLRCCLSCPLSLSPGHTACSAPGFLFPCSVRSCTAPFPLCLNSFLLSLGFITLPRILAVRKAVALYFLTVSFCHSQSDEGQTPPNSFTLLHCILGLTSPNSRCKTDGICSVSVLEACKH